MNDFTNKTYQAILQQMLDRVPNTYDKRDTSPIPTALGPAAWALEGFYLILSQVQQQGYIQTATGDNLDMLSILAGVARSQASPAVRLGIFNIAVPIGSRFSTVNGADSINFIVTAASDTKANQYQLTAETAGSIGNDYVGPILPISTIPGLTSAQISDILVPGEDTESDNVLRQRIISALNERPYGGNIANYREWATDISGVGAVQVWPTWNGGGTVKLSLLGADFLPASSVLVETVQSAIDPPPNQGLGLGLAPIGATVTVTAPETVAVDIAATLTLTPGSTVEQVKPLVEAAIQSYFLDTRKNWATPLSSASVEYNADIFLARVTAAILSVAGVLNATGVTLNGTAADLSLIQSGELQQVAIMGGVTLGV